MIEKVTGNAVTDEFQRRILRPLGLTSIFLEGFQDFPSSRLSKRYHYATDAFRRDAGINKAFKSLLQDDLQDRGTSRAKEHLKTLEPQAFPHFSQPNETLA